MISILSRIFIKDRNNVSDPRVREAYGVLCGAVGIGLNIILFALKYFAGVISGSIAITADAFNNLSDAGSSVVTLVGFRLAGKKADPGHPFGHGRIEYISGLIVSAVILIVGFELGKTSFGKILHPEAIEVGLLPAAILLASICVKVYMCLYNRAVAKKISSSAMLATATDSLTDSVATAVVLISMGVARFTGANIDGWAGILVAAFILYSGYGAAKDTLSPLLGQAPDPEFVKKVERIVMSHPKIEGIHDLIVHDYGPGRVIISLHAEVDGKGDIYELHDEIDNVERELKTDLGCLATVHMDPIETDNSAVSQMRADLARRVKEIAPSATIHDLRIVPGPTHTNVIFDAVVPYGLKMSDEEVTERLRKMVEEDYPNHYAVVNIDKAYA